MLLFEARKIKQTRLHGENKKIRAIVFLLAFLSFSRVFRKFNLLVNDLFTQNGRKNGLQFAVFFHIFQGFVAFFYQPDFRNSVFFEKSVYLIISNTTNKRLHELENKQEELERQMLIEKNKLAFYNFGKWTTFFTSSFSYNIQLPPLSDVLPLI